MHTPTDVDICINLHTFQAQLRSSYLFPLDAKSQYTVAELIRSFFLSVKIKKVLLLFPKDCNFMELLAGCLPEHYNLNLSKSTVNRYLSPLYS